MGAGIAAACLLRDLPVTMIERDKGSRNAEHIMKLVEVITSDHASPTALVTVFALAKPLGKIAVPSGVCDGFIGSRIMSA